MNTYIIHNEHTCACIRCVSTYIYILFAYQYILTERDIEKERETERDRETERQRDRETERQRDRDTETQRDRERPIETERDSVYIDTYIYIHSRVQIRCTCN